MAGRLLHKSRKGFTIIEVTFFLAISGALLAMVIAGTSTAVARRRYNDAVNDLAEQLRNAYSAVINVENGRIGDENSSRFCSVTSAFNDVGSFSVNGKHTDNFPGRTRCAVYGQLLTIGEKGNDGKQNPRMLHRYDIIGVALDDNIEPDSQDGLDDTLISIRDEAKANVITVSREEETAGKYMVQLAGNSTEYSTQWEATIEQVSEDRKPYVGAIMIVRSPVSGTVHTYTYKADEQDDNSFNNLFEIQEFLNTHRGKLDDITGVLGESFINKAIKDNKMTLDDAIICVGSDDLYAVSNRRAIKVRANGSNESAVELMPMDQEGEICKK